MGSAKKEDQERVKVLLKDTVTLLCKNGLNFKKNLKVQGLLGITLDDDDVFLVQLDEIWGQRVTEQPEPVEKPSFRKSAKRKRRKSSESNRSIDLDPDVVIKSEPTVIVLDPVETSKVEQSGIDFNDLGLELDSTPSSISNQNLSENNLNAGDNSAGFSLNLQPTIPAATKLEDTPYITNIVPNTAREEGNASHIETHTVSSRENSSLNWNSSQPMESYPTAYLSDTATEHTSMMAAGTSSGSMVSKVSFSISYVR